MPAPHVRSEGGQSWTLVGIARPRAEGRTFVETADRSDSRAGNVRVWRRPAISLGLILWRGRIVWHVADKGGRHSRRRAGKEGPKGCRDGGRASPPLPPRDSTSSTVSLPGTPTTVPGRLVCTMHFARFPSVASPSGVTHGLNYKCTAQERGWRRLRLRPGRLLSVPQQRPLRFPLPRPFH